ncbi:MAG TPA: sulfotransferase [Solirubrobacterales bacterium]|nr:sulfotransferase [Solirubrobacterales bacterium]
MSADHDFPAPILVGGSARSGTHAIGRMVGTLPRYQQIKLETRFVVGTGGLCDLLEGRTTLRQFRRKVYGKWWSRGLRHARGLQVIIERTELEAAMERFEAGYKEDPWGAARQLVADVHDPVAERGGKPSWVELSGQNIEAAPTMRKLLPNARFIHMVRDGRAVVAGIMRKRDMTDDRAEAMAHWARRARNAADALRQLPPGTALTVQLEDLAANDREGAFNRVVEFLELDDPAPMREYFDREITPERAHVGAWRERVSPADVRWIEFHYRRHARRLQADGVDWLADPEPVWGLPLAGRRPPVNA